MRELGWKSDLGDSVSFGEVAGSSGRVASFPFWEHCRRGLLLPERLEDFGSGEGGWGGCIMSSEGSG